MKNLFRYCILGSVLFSATCFSFWISPGTTFCEEDTQIYLPILQQMLDPSVLRHDLITQYPHTQFTLYDELIVFVTRHSGLDLRAVMRSLHFVFRFFFVLGFFLISKGIRLSDGIAVAVASLMLLGGSVPGPAINIVELEPIPRMMAFSMVVMAMGLLSLRHLYSGTFFACLGYWLHPTTTLPFWGGWLWVILTGHLRMGNKQRLLLATLPTGAMGVLVYAASRSPSEPSRYFWSLLDPKWEGLLWLRTPYDFVSGWTGFQMTLLAGLALILGLAYWRSRHIIGGVLKRLIWPTTLFAGAMLLCSWLFLDCLKMAIMAQVQPARAVLFPVVWVLLLSWVSAVHGSLSKENWAEGILWVMSALAFVVDQYLLLWLWPVLGLESIKGILLEGSHFRRRKFWLRASCFIVQGLAVFWALKSKPFGFNGLSPKSLTELAILLGLALFLFVFLRWFKQKKMTPDAEESVTRLSTELHTLRNSTGSRVNVPLLAYVLAVFLLVPAYLRNPWHPADPANVYELADWANRNTPVDSVFLFPDAGRSKVSGYFRYRSQRAIYVDWKGGGQVNFSRRFAREWWHRWQTSMSESQPLGSGYRLTGLPVDFVVTKAQNRLLELPLVYQTASFNVYRIQ
jgi:hypothetical protein